jgi:YD repeat-containing protein
LREQALLETSRQRIQIESLKFLELACKYDLPGDTLMSRLVALLLSLSCCVFIAVHQLAPITHSQSTNRSVSLDGNTQHVNVPYNANLNITGALTVEAWVKTSSVAYQMVVERGDWSQALMSYDLMIGDGKVRMDVKQTSGNYLTVMGSTAMSTGAWHHIAGVYDGSNMKVYLDGVLDGTASCSLTPGDNTTGLKIGRSTNLYLPFPFIGLIDEVRVSSGVVYSGNFTPSAHLTTNAGANATVKGLWKFDGDTTTDSSASGAHGSLQNNASYSTDVPNGPNNAPTISITDPLNNTTFSGGSNIVIDASASDADGSVAQVEFFQGSTSLGADSAAPYTLVWNNVSAGSYSLTARATDDLGATTTATPITVVVAQSATDKSVSLNGSTQHVDVPYNANLNITGALTVEAWIKTNSVAYQMVLERGDWSQGLMSYDLMIADDKLRMDIKQSSGTYVSVVGNTSISTGAWHHVAGVYDGSNMKVYLDGVLDGTATATLTPGNNTTGLKIGRSTNVYFPFPFTGLIDEVRVSAGVVYSGNFTPSAHLTPNAGASATVKGLWKFDGDTANDSSGSGAHGSLQNGATYSTDVPSSSNGSERPVAVPSGPSSAQRGVQVTFNGSGSFDPDGTISAYHWNFGDGTTSNAANPNHAYQTSGVFIVTLTVTDNSGLLSSATMIVGVNGASEAEVDPGNQTGGGGENPLSRNFNWNLPLVSLSGRAGLDLNLDLSYNSLIWLKRGNTISFDSDYGFPGPGFRLGFPSLQGSYFNSETGKWSYVLIGSDGSHTELRRVDTNNSLYESADSSHLLLDVSQLTASDPSMLLRTAAGMQLKFKPQATAFECTEIKDRNGNYITINYSSGRIANIHDTLDRVINFEYENGWLTKINQAWKKPEQPTQSITHTWASFDYANISIATNFSSSLSVAGPANNSTIKVLSRVTISDNSLTISQNTHFDFAYTSWGQLWKISHQAPDDSTSTPHTLNYRTYKLPGSPLLSNVEAGAQDDCPRFTQRRDWGQFVNGDTNGTIDSNEEIVTSFDVQDASWNMPNSSTSATGRKATVIHADGTANKVTEVIYFIGTAASDGWRRGLPALVDTYDSNGTLRRRAMTTWEQDDTSPSKSYILNPRVKESNIYDPAPSTNRKRTEITYRTFTYADGLSCKFPEYIYEYGTDAATLIRTTYISYKPTADYAPRRILGLVSEQRLYDGDAITGILMSRLTYEYDENGSIDGANTPIHHDGTNYPASLIVGRGNITSVSRQNVEIGVATTVSRKYDRAGSVISVKDPGNHEMTIAYNDNFSDGGNSRGTFAYPKTVTDPAGFVSTSVYNFDFGAVSSIQTPKPNITTYQPGPIRWTHFDDLGRAERITNSVNSAYTRYLYSSSGNQTDVYSTVKDGASQQAGTEAHSFSVADGFGRTIATAIARASGGYNGQRVEYDVMGRVYKTFNPVETSADGNPSAWNTTGADDGSNWSKFTKQEYDWKGRPTVTTNQENKTRQISYEGCGCAGGEVSTVLDEGDGTQRRQQKIYTDVLGRVYKTEVYEWQTSTIYATTVNTYNVRDQITKVREYVGAASPSSAYRDTTMDYDGFGRLIGQHAPQQQAESGHSWTSDHTTFHYDSEDNVDYTIDARGVVKYMFYDNRHQLKGISHYLSALPSGQTQVAPTADQAFEYDSVGNRTKITDGTGTISLAYNDLSQLTSETRVFTDLPNQSYALSYDYTIGGQLKRITDPANTKFKYTYDTGGRITSIIDEGTLVANVSNYATGLEYRAWGALRDINFGNGTHQHVDFNSRFLPTDSTLSNLVVGSNSSASMSWSYDYYDDGRQRHAFDSNDNRFDRLLQYDHMGRLKEAYSGREARGQSASSPVPDSPYRQSFIYNAFNERAQKTGRFWRNTQSGNTPCVPRQSADGCDAEGHLLSFSNDVHQYDAAGQQVRYENWRSTVGGESYPVQPSVTLVQTYDALDRPAKRLETRRADPSDGGAPVETTATTFYVYSSVVGEKVMELDATGTKNAGYVYLAGARLAKQNIDGANSNVIWTNPNPGANSWVETNSSRIPERQEIDPDGAEVGTVDPWMDPVELPTYGELRGHEPLYIDGGDPFDYTGGYSVDGLPVSAAEFERLTGSGSAGYGIYVSGVQVAFAKYQKGFSFFTVGFDVFLQSKKDRHGEMKWLLGSLDIEFAYDAKSDQGSKGGSKKAQPGEQTIDSKAFVQAIADCIKELYGPDFAMTSFKPTTDPSSGLFQTDDEYNGVIGIRDSSGQTFNVVNDPTPPDDVKADIHANQARGRTDSDNPYWTWAYPAGDTKGNLRPGELRYPELFLAPGMVWGRVQVHELGAALTHIRNKYHPGPYAPRLPDKLDPDHRDDGPSMEDCVGRKYYAAKGLTSH